ncbi:MAG: DUF1553 domain-containing protein [Sedimentisphaerales bacterium]|nr:DUF1553 domain-containing protein [Sedimentisphaerales bacterium]
MRELTISLLTCIFTFSGGLYGAAAVIPFEINAGFAINNPIDQAVLDSLTEHQIAPANLCSDAVFVRRVYFDLIGTLPTAQEVRKFLGDKRLDKRTKLVDTLLARDEFAAYWTLKWCDVLRVKAEYPVNLWPNAVQAYHRWIFESVRDNKPYDEFARELLTASGSNFRVPPVNFYRAIQGRKPADIADAAALTFMGTRLKIWPQKSRQDMETFFSRLAYKSTAEWKEEIVYPDPAQTEPLEAVFPDGTKIKIAPDDDPRKVFADWLIQPDNPWFARAMANRAWSWLMGRGIIHEPDDIRPDNPPANPALLKYLEAQLVQSDWNIRHLFKLICTSRTYQQSSIPQSDDPKTQALFACYLPRQMDAEVLIDALCYLGGTEVKYSSAIPEPFTFIPDEHRTIELADGSITSQFLEMFGRPARDTGLESERNSHPTDVQRLFMLNSSDVRKKITQSPLLRKIFNTGKGKPREMIASLYITILSRYPTPQEYQTIEKHFASRRNRTGEAAEDLTWALLNSREFLFRH